MWWGVLMVVLSQSAPPSDATIVLTTNVGIDSSTSEQLAFSAQRSLSNRGLRVKQAIDSCKGERACLARQGRVLNSRTVVSLSLVKLGDQVVVDLECLRSKTGEAIAATTFSAKSSASATEFDTLLKDFVDKVLAAVPPQPVDVPVAENKRPLQPTEEADVETMNAAAPVPGFQDKRSATLSDRLPAILVGVGATALAATAIVFAVRGANRDDSLKSTQFAIAGISGGVSAILFATAITLFFID